MYQSVLMNDFSQVPKVKPSPYKKPSRIRGNDETRKRILSAAATVVARYGMKKTTIRKIAREAKVSGGLVMHYFGSKVELIHHIFRSGNPPLSKYLRTHLDQFHSPEELVLGAMEAYLPRDIRNSELTREIMANSWLWSKQDEIKYASHLGELADIVADALQEKFYPGQVTLTQTATYTLASAYVGVLRMGLQKGWEKQTYINVMTPAFRMILAGLDAEVKASISKDGAS